LRAGNREEKEKEKARQPSYHEKRFYDFERMKGPIYCSETSVQKYAKLWNMLIKLDDNKINVEMNV
jgi:hypothetical protein